nr:hypothetical protein Q903MT_gene3222 [Picea sitchensis]
MLLLVRLLELLDHMLKLVLMLLVLVVDKLSAMLSYHREL